MTDSLYLYVYVSISFSLSFLCYIYSNEDNRRRGCVLIFCYYSIICGSIGWHFDILFFSRLLFIDELKDFYFFVFKITIIMQKYVFTTSLGQHQAMEVFYSTYSMQDLLTA